MFTDDQLLPLSALQHYLFCPRQAALIHLEQAWAENRFIAEGNALHQKAHDADRAQLCAQAMCLEEMLKVQITEGFLFYGQRKRRTTVEFDAGLRQLVETVVKALHEMIASRVTPPAEYKSRRCDSCSLIELCQPKALRLKRGVAAWFASAVRADHQTAETGESGA